MTISDLPKISVSTLKVSDAIVSSKTGKEEVYVLNIIDQSKQIFIGLRIPGKIPFNFISTDLVTLINVPEIGSKLLELK